MLLLPKRPAADLREIITAEKQIILTEQQAIPEDPYEQLRVAIAAVFNSWMGRRAIDYRRVSRIPDTLGTAVTVQAMVFGNMGAGSGTGVAFTRNPSTGKKELYGEYLLNAQGEDVVAGIRTPNPISQLKKELPAVYEQFASIANLLERHYHDMQDCEFTIERGKLWMLQTRTGKRSGAAAVRIAVEMEYEKLIDRATAIQRVTPEQLDQLLHPTVDPKTNATVLATGLPASPGAAQGQVVFSPDDAEELAREGAKVVLVRQETSPDDFHGMVAAQAIVTARGGMTSHAAVVARGMGKTCVSGANALNIDYSQQQFTVDGTVVTKGEWITVDGSTGRVFLGQIPTIQPTLGDDFYKLMTWADQFRRLRVRANADTPLDAKTARQFGAEGIGLCRTEHMFFGDQRLAAMREMILSEGVGAREKALERYRSEQWYGAADVDSLSEHEARVIAARLVNRARFDLPGNRLSALTEDLALVFARHLKLRDEECDTRRDVIEAELVKAASKHLNPQQMAELRKSGEQGIAALPGEDK